MLKTLLGIPIHQAIDNKAIRLLESIKNFTIGEFRLYLPVSDRSYSVQCNDCIKVAKNFGCDYVCLLDADCWLDEKSTGWLQKLEKALDYNKNFGLLMWSNAYDKNDDSIKIADETRDTSYIASILVFYRVSSNIWFDEDYLYHQSADPCIVREFRRQNWLTGYVPSIHINHYWNDNNENPNYQLWKTRNEQVFGLKWGTDCHTNPPDWSIRNKWRGVCGRQDISNLEQVGDQYKQLKPYFDESNTLFLNDLEYIKKNKIKPLAYKDDGGDGYYSISEQDPSIMPQHIFMKLLNLQDEIYGF